MNYSNILNLDEFFFALRDQEYALIKISDGFPKYYPNSDVDIFCANVSTISKIIISVGNKYISDSISIKVTQNTDNIHTFIDFFYLGKLDIRFDLYSAMPSFKSITISNYYLYSVIDNRDKITRKYKSEKYSIYIPSKIDDLVLRYVDYFEWYDNRPDKIKHLDYILKFVEHDDDLKEKFINRIHLYAQLPNARRKKDNRSYFFSRYLSTPIYYLKMIRANGIIGSFIKLKSKIIGSNN